MEAHEQLQAAYTKEVRDKYKQSDRDDMAKSGQAMPDGSYPIRDAEDLTRAIRAVGRGGADHDAIRKHIMACAKKLNLSDQIPDNWNSDGSLNQQNAGPLVEWRRRKAEMLAKHPERREFSTTDFELRETQDGVLKFSGYASVTEQPYEVGFYTETIQRGAFKRTLAQDPDVQLLINHGEGGSGMPIARTGRNMTLVEDDRGLRVDAQLDAEDPDVVLLARKMRSGLIDQMSFAFQATEQEWNEDYTQRSIKAASIHRGDVSVVNQGANGASMAALRSREVVQALRSGGFEGLLSALTEWRDLTVLPLEERAGKTLSSSTMDTLSNVLNLVARIDDATDQAQAMLAELMGVSSPDSDDASSKSSGRAPDGEGDGAKSTTTDGRARDVHRLRLVQLEQEQRVRALRRLK
jgi:HK97 family phage prohead protease